MMIKRSFLPMVLSTNLLHYSFSMSILLTLTFPIATTSYQLTIIHYNDLHSRFQEIDANGNSCSAEEREKEECYGGFARLKGKVNEIQRKFNNTILLNAGDYFQGTLWFTIHGYKLLVDFMNRLNHSAVAIGSHEFDDGVEPFVPFLENFKYPVVSCNINDKQELAMQNKYKKSIIVTIDNGEKIGIVGYISVETKVLASPGRLNFYNVIDSVSAEAKALHDRGIKTIIALGYNGISEDQDLCRSAPHVDIVVGGKTQLLLYTGTQPDSDKVEGPYPTVVKKNDGKDCLVVTASAFGKYLGFLQVEIDSEGNPVKWNGNPVLLDNTVDEDPEIQKLLDEWEGNNTKALSEIVGETKVLLDGRNTICRLRECNIGNVIADAMVFTCLQFANDFQWNYASLAIFNSGGIRGSIEEKNINGTITMADVYGVLPFRNKIDIVDIKGEYIRETFEHCVHDYDADNPYPLGKFLQVSGFRIKYDFCQPPGSRVVNISVRCNECRIPKFVPLDNHSYYQVVVPRFLAQGGDGFNVIKQNVLSTHNLGFIDSDVLKMYMKERGPIVTGIEQRIIINPRTNCARSSSSRLIMSFLFLLCATFTRIVGFPFLHRAFVIIVE